MGRCRRILCPGRTLDEVGLYHARNFGNFLYGRLKRSVQDQGTQVRWMIQLNLHLRNCYYFTVHQVKANVQKGHRMEGDRDSLGRIIRVCQVSRSLASPAWKMRLKLVRPAWRACFSHCLLKKRRLSFSWLDMPGESLLAYRQTSSASFSRKDPAGDRENQVSKNQGGKKKSHRRLIYPRKKPDARQGSSFWLALLCELSVLFLRHKKLKAQVVFSVWQEKSSCSLVIIWKLQPQGAGRRRRGLAVSIFALKKTWSEKPSSFQLFEGKEEEYFPFPFPSFGESKIGVGFTKHRPPQIHDRQELAGMPRKKNHKKP